MHVGPPSLLLGRGDRMESSVPLELRQDLQPPFCQLSCQVIPLRWGLAQSDAPRIQQICEQSELVSHAELGLPALVLGRTGGQWSLWGHEKCMPQLNKWPDSSLMDCYQEVFPFFKKSQKSRFYV